MGVWLFLLAIAWFTGILWASSRLQRLDDRLGKLEGAHAQLSASWTVLQERVEALRARAIYDEELIARLRADFTGQSPPAPPPPARAADSAESPPAPVSADAAPAAVSPEPVPAQAVAVAERAASAVEPEPVPPEVASLPVEVSAPPADAAPLPEAAPPPPAEAAAPGLEAPTPSADAPSAAPPSVEAPPQTAAPAPVSPEPGAAPAPTRPGMRGLDWESLVGVRLFSWVAAIAILLAAVLFLREAMDRGLLVPPIRLAIGIAVGTALLVVTETRHRGRWSVTADALGAAGIAILFASFFAGAALWHVIPQLAAFALMALVTAVAVLLAIRHDSIFTALLGLVGGFATPILLSTGEDRPIGLFGYLLLLNAGLAWVGRRRGWTLLIGLSLAFTTVYEWGWVVRFLVDKPQELPIAVGVFLAFPVVVGASRLVSPHEGAKASLWFEHLATASALSPLLFALCFAWVPALGDHYLLLFGYLLVLDVALAVLAVALRQPLLHGAAALATLLVFAAWLPISYGAYAWPGVLFAVPVFVLLYLLAPLWAAPLSRRLSRGDAPAISLRPARIVAPLLLLVIPALLLLEPRSGAPALPFGVLFALLAAIAVVAVADGAGALYFVAAFVALVAEGVWSSRYLSPDRLQAGLLLYAAFGVFYLSAPLVARRYRRPLEPGWSASALLVASLGLLLFLAAGPVAHVALWGMAILLAILNLGLFLDPRPGKVAGLAAVGMVLSWVVIAVWWTTAMVASLLLPALAIVGGLAVLMLGGNLWVEHQPEARSSRRAAVYLGLVGHLFLLYVATRPSLAAPPWPLFGVLVVLDLAVLAAALYSRRAELHISATAASQVIVAVWLIVTCDLHKTGLGWPQHGILAAMGLAVLAAAAIPLAARRAAQPVLFTSAFAVALLGAQLVVALAAVTCGAKLLVWAVVAETGLLVALAVLSARRGWHGLMTGALAPYALGLFGWILTCLTDHALSRGEAVAMAAAPYAVWLAYPVVLGRRALPTKLPHVTAVLASALAFGAVRWALEDSPWDRFVGALPLTQAILLMGLVGHLVRIEPREGRDRGRLALVAGTALAFVTAAIPLQLDRQWITIGWALEAAALAWLYRRIPHKGLLATSGGLAAAVMIRLCLNPAVLEYHPRGAVPVLNWYLYAYLVAATSLLAAAALLRGEDDRIQAIPALPRLSPLLRAGATILLFLLLNIEIADYWSTGGAITFNFSSGLAQDLTYTLGWALFAIVLLAVGIVRDTRLTRLTALVLLVATVAKAFLHDLWRLGGLYRVGSFVGLAVSLALVALVLQRFVLESPTKKSP